MKSTSQAGGKLKTGFNQGEDKDEKNGGGENGDASDCTIEAPELKYR